MRKKNDVSDRRFWAVRWNLILLAFVFLVFLASLIFMHRIAEENAHWMGSEITHSYSLEDGYNWEVYGTLLEIGSQYIQELAVKENDYQVLEEWMRDYFLKMREISGSDTMNPYVYLNGHFIEYEDCDLGEEYDATQTDWYRKAVEAEGQIIFTDVYTDAMTGKTVITIAKECGDTGNVIAFDIFPQEFKIQGGKLPEGSTYFVCDSNGTLLYKVGSKEIDEETLESNFQNVYQKIQNNEWTEENKYYYDLDGKRMELYYNVSPNGWIFILSIPYSYLSQNWNVIVFMYGVALMVCMTALTAMWVKESGKRHEIRRINETVQILGNSYYAYYKINIRKETYEIIKGSEYVKAHIKPKGNYSELMGVFKELIIEEEYQEFMESFSIENIHRQLEKQIKDFGGDFRRLFGENYEWVNIRMLFAPALNGEEIVLCFRKIEDEKQHQLKRMALLEDALRAANTSENSQKQFFSSISHDMRTPLNVIIGMSKLAESYVNEPEKMEEYLKKINFSSRQLLGLINDVLEMSRWEQGLILDSKHFNIRECLEECVNVFRANTKWIGKQIEFSCDVKHEQVYGDVLRLEQIINNLVSNSLKFTGPGGCVAVRIKEIDIQERAKYQLTVEDTGIGMSQEFLQHIFVPYEREKRFKAQGAEGTGLGMPIVKNIVSLMGGEITVQSELNRGSKFTIILPFEIVGEKDGSDNGRSRASDEKEEQAIMDLNGRTILLAEDYALNMELTTDILEMNGARIIQAWNGKEALELFAESEEFCIDAILMDMQMPEMDGCEATRNIRSLPRADAGSVPIIALTANAFSEDIAQTVEAGMDAHISKPLDVKLLCTTLRRFMGENIDA